jgi:hypothetical protein
MVGHLLHKTRGVELPPRIEIDLIERPVLHGNIRMYRRLPGKP